MAIYPKRKSFTEALIVHILKKQVMAKPSSCFLAYLNSLPFLDSDCILPMDKPLFSMSDDRFVIKVVCLKQLF